MNRRLSLSSSASVKRPAASVNPAKLPASVAEQAKKRVALGNITNKSNVGKNPNRTVGAVGAKGGNVGIPCIIVSLPLVSLIFF